MHLIPLRLFTGADNIKKYWSRYYQGSQGVVFVLDSASSDEDLEAARNELHSALQHPQLCTLPFLILANHQDKPAARTPNQVNQPRYGAFNYFLRSCFRFSVTYKCYTFHNLTYCIHSAVWGTTFKSSKYFFFLCVWKGKHHHASQPAAARS